MEKVISRLIKETGLMGAAVGIIDNGKIETCFFGHRDGISKKPIDESCYFEIASNSKAFTTMLGAIGKDRGIFDWDTPIINYMPEFSMPCPYATTHVTGRDLASHRTGVPRHDFMRERVEGTRRDTVLRTAFMDFNKPFRTTYQYNNQQFIILGYIFELIFGATWEELVRNEIANPLGMDLKLRFVDGNMEGVHAALPHYSDGFAAHPGNWTNNPASGPAGGVRTNLKSMLKWVQMLLDEGQYDNGKTLVTKEAFADLVTPAIITPSETESPKEKSSLYSLAWHVSVYGGQLVVHHSGSVSGFNSRVGFLPGQNKGYVVLLNTAGTPAGAILNRLLLDRLTGTGEQDYMADIDKFIETRDKRVENDKKIPGYKVLGAESAGLYCGRFYHEAFDDFEITLEQDRLIMHYGAFKGILRQMENGRIAAFEEGADPYFVKLTPASGAMYMECLDSELVYRFRKV